MIPKVHIKLLDAKENTQPIQIYFAFIDYILVLAYCGKSNFHKVWAEINYQFTSLCKQNYHHCQKKNSIKMVFDSDKGFQKLSKQQNCSKTQTKPNQRVDASGGLRIPLNPLISTSEMDTYNLAKRKR